MSGDDRIGAKKILFHILYNVLILMILLNNLITAVKGQQYLILEPFFEPNYPFLAIVLVVAFVVSAAAAVC